MEEEEDKDKRKVNCVVLYSESLGSKDGSNIYKRTDVVSEHFFLTVK